MRRYFWIALAMVSLMAMAQSIAVKESQAGEESCASCHPKLTGQLPKGHPEVSGKLQDCLTCHSKDGGASPFEWLVHFYHFSKEGFKGDCWSCHKMDPDGLFLAMGVDKKGVKVERETVEKMRPYFQSWAASKFMDYQHAAKKISCAPCHDTFFPEKRASQEQCLKCHESYEKVAELTKKNFEHNPHNSHLGEIRCTLCHRAHAKSTVYCVQCHKFEDLVFSKEK